MSYISATAEIMYAPLDLRLVGMVSGKLKEGTGCIVHLNLSKDNLSRDDSTQLATGDAIGKGGLQRLALLHLDMANDGVVKALGRRMLQRNVRGDGRALPLPGGRLPCHVFQQAGFQLFGVGRQAFGSDRYAPYLFVCLHGIGHGTERAVAAQ